MKSSQRACSRGFAWPSDQGGTAYHSSVTCDVSSEPVDARSAGPGSLAAVAAIGTALGRATTNMNHTRLIFLFGSCAALAMSACGGVSSGDDDDDGYVSSTLVTADADGNLTVVDIQRMSVEEMQ